VALHPNRYHIVNGKATVIVFTAKDAKRLCTVPPKKNPKIGIIVGSIAGAVGAIAIAILLAAFWHRIREIANRIFGNVGAPAGAQATVFDNPVYSAAESQASLIHS